MRTERFYTIPKEHETYKQYFEWFKDVELTQIVVKRFMESNGFETTEYAVWNGALMIVPKGGDETKFGKLLSKHSTREGLRSFKKTSVINKLFMASIENAGVKNIRKPAPWHITGRSSWRLFHIQEILYASLAGDYEFENPEGWNEIKASEFYKAIESEDDKCQE